jgi:hypothetical protein
MFNNISIIDFDHAKYIYLGTMTLIHFLYFATFIGMFAVNQLYVNYLNVFIQTFIVLFLAARFHPFRSQPHRITTTDTTIVFGSAILLGTNLLTVEFAKWLPLYYVYAAQTYIKDHIKNIITIV